MYILTFPSGRTIKFHLKGCAEIFQQCYGGVITERERMLGETVE